jgi:hypothetical protein
MSDETDEELTYMDVDHETVSAGLQSWFMNALTEEQRMKLFILTRIPVHSSTQTAHEKALERVLKAIAKERDRDEQLR